MAESFPNENAQWAYVIAETLHRRGVRRAVLCPGSRNSPLVFAFAQHAGIEAISVLDERAAGFFALGLARQSGQPVALACTSGTAAANFFPAIIEASHSGAPLVVLTADRPPELRQCAAGQTIDQVKLYGNYVTYQQELPVPANDLSLLRSLRQAVSHAVGASAAAGLAPVHLNISLREPLAPVETADFVPALNMEETSFFEHLGAKPLSVAPSSLDLSAFCSTEKGLILVGPSSVCRSSEWFENVARFCASVAWPVLADGISSLRNYADKFPRLMARYDLVARAKVDSLAPEKVFVIGEMPTSKALREWLGECQPEMLFLTERIRNADPTFGRSSSQLCDFEYIVPVAESGGGSFARQWLEIDEGVNQEMDTFFESCEDLFEGKAAWLLSQSLPQEALLCVSNSMPPRDLEFFGKIGDRKGHVVSSRGASGIDGILSSAMGVAHGGGEAYLLTGDLALLHDSSGAVSASSCAGSLTIVLINNNGGGIFEMLPISNFEPVFESYLATPQDMDFAKWAATYGMSYRKIETWSDFQAALKEKPSPGVRLLELQTDRKADAELRKQLFQDLTQALRDAIS